MAAACPSGAPAQDAIMARKGDRACSSRSNHPAATHSAASMRPPSSAAFPGDEFTATPGAVTGIVSPPNAIGDGSIMADGRG